MELVIKIPEECYRLLQNEGIDWFGAEHILNAVANGVPLPKGHGKLVDVDRANVVAKETETVEDERIIRRFLDNLQPIIEADKGASNAVSN